MVGGSLSVLLEVGGNVLARHGSVIVQVRTGALSHEVFGALVANVRRLTPHKPGPIGMLAVIEADAEVVETEVRARQKDFVTRLLERPEVRMAVVVVGDDVAASMRRTMARMLVPSNERLRACGDVEEGCAFVGPHAGVPTAALVESVTEARAVAARSWAKR